MTYTPQTPITEVRHDGGFLVSEANGHRSRDEGILTSGLSLQAGAVLGVTTLAGTATAAANAGNTGNGTFGTITAASPAVPGAYRLNMTAATKFIVYDPSGVEVGAGTTGVAFALGGLSFTLTAGGTAFVLDDGFTITVAAGTGKYVAYLPAATDGSQIPAAILFANVDATLNDTSCTVVVRSCEVNASELIWDASVSSPQITAGLATLKTYGIIAR